METIMGILTILVLILGIIAFSLTIIVASIEIAGFAKKRVTIRKRMKKLKEINAILDEVLELLYEKECDKENEDKNTKEKDEK